MQQGPVADILTLRDFDAFQRLAQSVGWGFTNEQVKTFFALGTLFGHRLDGELISCTGVFRHGKPWATIGIVIVNPRFQRMGLGGEVLRLGLHEARRTSSVISLVSTDAGLSLYRAAGFETVSEIHRFERDARPASDVNLAFGSHTRRVGHGASQLRQLVSGDEALLLQFDAAVTGADRTRMYRELLAGMNAGFVVRHEGRQELEGLGVVMPRGFLHSIGPVLAKDADVAVDIVAEMAAVHRGMLRIDVPGEQKRLMDALREMGFREMMVSPLMTWQGRALPGQRTWDSALADPAFG